MELAKASSISKSASRDDGLVVDDSLSLADSDDVYLKSLGKTAELDRVYNFWTCTFLVISRLILAKH